MTAIRVLAVWTAVSCVLGPFIGRALSLGDHDPQ